MSAIRIWWRAVIPRVCSVLERGQLGLQPAGKPLGSFLFLGPTGVGKMELTLEFTRYLFGDESVFRFDMSEFLHLHGMKPILSCRSIFSQSRFMRDSGQS